LVLQTWYYLTWQYKAIQHLAGPSHVHHAIPRFGTFWDRKHARGLLSMYADKLTNLRLGACCPDVAILEVTMVMSYDLWEDIEL